MKNLPAPADGKAWTVAKTDQGIPFITDGVTRKWCVSFFHTSPTNARGKPLVQALPALECGDDVSEAVATAANQESAQQSAAVHEVKTLQGAHLRSVHTVKILNVFF